MYFVNEVAKIDKNKFFKAKSGTGEKSQWAERRAVKRSVVDAESRGSGNLQCVFV